MPHILGIPANKITKNEISDKFMTEKPIWWKMKAEHNREHSTSLIYNMELNNKEQ